MENFPTGKYKTILVDNPWEFKTRSNKGLEGRPQHYKRMSIAEIKAMPVRWLADEDCWLFFWATSPHLKQALEVIDAWGFEYSSVAFNWVKLNAKAGSKLFITGEDLFKGMGYTTRKNAELCLLAKIGNPKRHNRKVQELVIDPRREHSRKPDEIYGRIETYAAGPYLELFARTQRPGWTAWGNETEKFT